MTHVLFVCSCNTFRSALAEHFARDYAERKNIPMTFESAGTLDESHEVDLQLIMLMSKIEKDMSEHVPQSLTHANLSNADVIIGMSQEHVEYLEELGYTAHLYGTLARGRRELETEWRGFEKDLTRFELDTSAYFNNIISDISNTMPKIIGAIPRLAREARREHSAEEQQRHPHPSS